MEIRQKRPALNSRVILDLKKRSYLGMIYYLVALVGVIFPDGYYFRDPSFSRLFLGIVILICLFRLVHYLVSDHVPPRFKRLDFIIFAGSIVLNSLIWGLGFARLLGQEGEQNTQLLMLICTIGICSGGVVAYAPLLWLSISFNAFILLPGTLFMAVKGVYLPLAGLCMVFCSYLVFLAARINGEYWKALEIESLLEQKTRELEKISHMDGLTGLYNRRYFETAFEIEWRQAVRNQTRIAVLLCDIDKFKQVNDRFGHMAGDEYLKLTARILKKVFKRRTDVLVRYGGEEFVVLISDVSTETVLDLAENLRKEMEKTILEYESEQIQTTVSLGVVVGIPKPSDKKESMISKADERMYRAKNRGRNRVVAEEG
ncbi:GGDEF domain-containing protein [Desulfospira joergensenii]|uniref:GGDEF domain-containing protein n=1 Tax=Desulfospira joergensenii TaxID=53329 RepID=UPI0003B4A8EB|nr:GGDEF domain-containing protein [Desulfospira joergensenii]